ncbi:hypothetical protein AB751O23_CA_00010, partial [Chlamydiales bacterium SCGC AB-751-O23]
TYLISIINDLLEAQVWEIESTQLDNFIPTEIGALETKTTNVNSPTITYFSKAQMESLEKEQIQAAILEWTLTQIQAITSSQLSLFLDTEITAMPTASLVQLTPTQLSYLTPTQVHGLTHDQVLNMTSEQLDVVIGYFDSTQEGYPTTTQNQDLAAYRALRDAIDVSLLTPLDFSSLEDADFLGFNSTQALAITNLQLMALNEDQLALVIAKLTPSQIETYVATVNNKIPDLDFLIIPTLDEFQTAKLDSSTLTLDQVQAIYPNVIALMDKTFISNALTRLDPLQIAALKEEQIILFDINDFALITTDDDFIVSMTPAQVNYFTGTDSDPIGPQLNPLLSNESLQLLTPSQVLILANRLTDNLRWGDLTDLQKEIYNGGAVTKIDPSDIENTDVSEWSSGDIQDLYEGQIENLTDDQLAQIITDFTPEQMTLLDDDQIEELDVDVINKLTGAQLLELEPEQLQLFDEDQIQAIQETALKDLEPLQITAILEDLSDQQIKWLSEDQVGDFIVDDILILNEVDSTTGLAKITLIDAVNLEKITDEVVVQSISEAAISQMSKEQVAALITRMSEAQIIALTDAQVLEIEDETFALITPTQANYFPLSDFVLLGTFPSEEIDGEVVFTYTKSTQTPGFTVEQLNALDTLKIKAIFLHLTTTQLPGLELSQLADVPFDYIVHDAFTAEQRSAMSREQINATSLVGSERGGEGDPILDGDWLETRDRITTELAAQEKLIISKLSTYQYHLGRGNSQLSLFNFYYTKKIGSKYRKNNYPFYKYSKVLSAEARKMVNRASAKEFYNTKVSYAATNRLVTKLTTISNGYKNKVSGKKGKTLKKKKPKAYKETKKLYRFANMMRAQANLLKSKLGLLDSSLASYGSTKTTLDSLRVEMDLIQLPEILYLLNQERVEALTATQIKALKNTDIEDITDANMSYFSADQLKNLTIEALGALSHSQLNVMSKEAVFSLFTRLSDTQIKELEDDHLINIKDTQTSKFSTAESNNKSKLTIISIYNSYLVTELSRTSVKKFSGKTFFKYSSAMKTLTSNAITTGYSGNYLGAISYASQAKAKYNAINQQYLKERKKIIGKAGKKLRKKSLKKFLLQKSAVSSAFALKTDALRLYNNLSIFINTLYTYEAEKAVYKKAFVYNLPRISDILFNTAPTSAEIEEGKLEAQGLISEQIKLIATEDISKIHLDYIEELTYNQLNAFTAEQVTALTLPQLQKINGTAIVNFYLSLSTEQKESLTSAQILSVNLDRQYNFEDLAKPSLINNKTALDNQITTLSAKLSQAKIFSGKSFYTYGNNSLTYLKLVSANANSHDTVSLEANMKTVNILYQKLVAAYNAEIAALKKIKRKKSSQYKNRAKIVNHARIVLNNVRISISKANTTRQATYQYNSKEALYIESLEILNLINGTSQ